jgi:hypothetical protein
MIEKMFCDMELTPRACELLLSGQDGAIIKSAISLARTHNAAKVNININGVKIAQVFNPDLSRNKAFKRTLRKYSHDRD